MLSLDLLPLCTSTIRTGHAGAIAYGRPFLANPDLPRRLRLGAVLNDQPQRLSTEEAPPATRPIPRSPELCRIRDAGALECAVIAPGR